MRTITAGGRAEGPGSLSPGHRPGWGGRPPAFKTLSRRAAPVISDPSPPSSSAAKSPRSSQSRLAAPVISDKKGFIPPDLPAWSQSRRAAPVISDGLPSGEGLQTRSTKKGSQSRRAAPVISDLACWLPFVLREKSRNPVVLLRSFPTIPAPPGTAPRSYVAIPSCCSGHFRLSPLQPTLAEPFATPSAVTPSRGCGKRLSPRRSAPFIVSLTSFPLFS
jgi:hypothetical protein